MERMNPKSNFKTVPLIVVKKGNIAVVHKSLEGGTKGIQVEYSIKGLRTLILILERALAEEVKRKEVK